MAYILRHSDKSGNINVERVCGNVREIVAQERAQELEGEFRASVITHKDACKQDRLRNGWTGKKKIFRRIAQVPANHYRQLKTQIDPTDRKALKSFIKENQYNTVARDSF